MWWHFEVLLCPPTPIYHITLLQKILHKCPVVKWRQKEKSHILQRLADLKTCGMLLWLTMTFCTQQNTCKSKIELFHNRQWKWHKRSEGSITEMTFTDGDWWKSTYHMLLPNACTRKLVWVLLQTELLENGCQCLESNSGCSWSWYSTVKCQDQISNIKIFHHEWYMITELIGSVPVTVKSEDEIIHFTVSKNFMICYVG